MRKMLVKGTNIYLTRGDTARLTLDIDLDPSFEIEKVFFTVKKTVESTASIISKKWETGVAETFGIKRTSPQTNKFVVSINHEDTSTRDFGKYRYDVQINYVDSNELAVVKILTIVKPSIFSIEEEVTQEGVT